MWWIIAAAIIALLAVIFIIVWFSGAGQKIFGGLDDTIGGLKDYDLDGATDLLDKCPCDAGQEIKPGELCQTSKDKCSIMIREGK